MKRWACVVAGGIGIAAFGFLPGADAAVEVCAGVRTVSVGTFLNLDQVECQVIGLPSIPTTMPVLGGPMPIDVPPLPPVELPTLPATPSSPDDTGQVCISAKFDGISNPVTGDQATCLGFAMPPLPLPEKIVYPQLPEIPVIPALPVPVPTPVPLPLP